MLKKGVDLLDDNDVVINNDRGVKNVCNRIKNLALEFTDLITPLRART